VGGGTITEHRTHGRLGLAWIWRVQQGIGIVAALGLQLVCTRTLSTCRQGNAYYNYDNCTFCTLSYSNEVRQLIYSLKTVAFVIKLTWNFGMTQLKCNENT
jgi:hypothetical protein